MRYRIIIALLFLCLTSANSSAQTIDIDGKAPSIEVDNWVYKSKSNRQTFKLVIFFQPSSKMTPELIDNLTQFGSKYDTKLDVILIAKSASSNFESLTKHLSDKRVSVGLDSNGSVFKAYGVSYVPFGVIINKRNRIVWMGTPSNLTEAELNSYLQ